MQNGDKCDNFIKIIILNLFRIFKIMRNLYLILFVSLFFSCSDKKNSLSEENLKGKVKSVDTYTYSAKEKFGENVTDELEDVEKNKYNKDGNLIEIAFYDEDGELYYKIKSKYDDGNLIESASYYDEGELISKFKFKYDDGNIIGSTEYDDDGELTAEWKYKYDDGNIIRRASYDKEGELSVEFKFKYDDEGNQIEQAKYDEDGELRSKLKYKYDDDGNRVEYKTIFYGLGDKSTTTYKYKYKEYDKQGNWIEREEREEENGTLKIWKISKREIKYY